MEHSITAILNSARTLKQGTTMHISKDAPEYIEAINYIGANEADMEKAGLSDGDEVNASSDFGTVTLPIKQMDLAPGCAFMPLSYLANRLVSPDTKGTGVPGFKDTQVTITKA